MPTVGLHCQIIDFLDQLSLVIAEVLQRLAQLVFDNSHQKLAQWCCIFDLLDELLDHLKRYAEPGGLEILI